MKLEKILFILSVLGILILMLIFQMTTDIYKGTIKSIQNSNNKITIQLEDSPVELILFETNSINLKKGDMIEFQGKQDVYNGQEQIIVDKIKLLDNFI